MYTRVPAAEEAERSGSAVVPDTAASLDGGAHDVSAGDLAIR